MFSNEGGVEKVVWELSTRMSGLGHTVTCLDRNEKVDTLPSDFQSKVLVKKVWTVNCKGLSAFSSSVSAAFLAAFGSYDIVHIHAEGPSAVIWLPKLLGKRCIVTIHGIDWQRAKWGRFAKSYIRHGEKNAAKYADEIIVLSRNTQQYFQDQYHRKTVYIPNGIDRPERCDADLIRNQYGLNKSDYILFLGRIVPEKGIHYLISAFHQLKTDKKLVIAGGASDTKEYYQKIADEARKDSRIILTGAVFGKLKQELYSNAYLYTLPTDLEGMPLSLLEAMSYGNCCLVSDIPECTEVIEDKAMTFRHSDMNDLADKLQYLCDHPDAVNRYRAMAADFICSKYNWDEVVQKTLKIYSGEK